MPFQQLLRCRGINLIRTGFDLFCQIQTGPQIAQPVTYCVNRPEWPASRLSIVTTPFGIASLCSTWLRAAFTTISATPVSSSLWSSSCMFSGVMSESVSEKSRSLIFSADNSRFSASHSRLAPEYIDASPAQPSWSEPHVAVLPCLQRHKISRYDQRIVQV